MTTLTASVKFGLNFYCFCLEFQNFGLNLYQSIIKNSIMKVIGFTNKFYTLWEVSDKYTNIISKYESQECQDFCYIQNLSFSLEGAMKKLEGQKFEIQLDLCGESTFTKKGEVMNNAPDNVFAFGKYCFKDIAEVNDIDYSKWYYSQRPSEFLKSFLEAADLFFIEDTAEWMTSDEFKQHKQELKDAKRIAKLERGHHFSDGEKIELELREFDSFSFDGYYGRTYIVSFESKCKKVFKYMGSNPPSLHLEGWSKVKATIKHDNYNDQDETKLQRIRLTK